MKWLQHTPPIPRTQIEWPTPINQTLFCPLHVTKEPSIIYTLPAWFQFLSSLGSIEFSQCKNYIPEVGKKSSPVSKPYSSSYIDGHKDLTDCSPLSHTLVLICTSQFPESKKH